MERILGVHVEEGMENCGGELELYISILQFVAENGRERIEDLDRFLEREDFANYTISIHALKSTLANIGAMEQSEMAKNLEMAGKEGRYDEIRAGHNKMMEMYEILLKNINDYLQNRDDGNEIENVCSCSNTALVSEDGDEQMSVEEIGCILEDVANLLEEFCYEEAEGVMEEMLEFDMGADVKQEVGKIYRDVANLRIDEAIERIRIFSKA